jgi:hypothetical protein
MEHGAVKVSGSPMSKPADDVGVANAIERDGFILKIFYERTLKLGIEIVLKEYIKRLDNYLEMRRLRRRERIPGDKDLGVAPFTELADNVVPFV